jgi:hypothetical protein
LRLVVVLRFVVWPRDVDENANRRIRGNKVAGDFIRELSIVLE